METNIHRTLKTMKVKEKVVFPIAKTASVRTMCTGIGMQTEKKFTTKTSRLEKTITVIRVK